ncbi:unnamed protein product [Schistocephalus solidus]|uniref:C2H2-type domain-containing protein n=1 Tax=Schistocephalus solidus TaxID=70667 RepID=A0A183SH45_SCHSO|nr:unnamed protein product [Schistocephalus solidus]
MSTEKTVVMHWPPPNTTYHAPRININGAQLKAVDTFTYLGSNLSRMNKIDDEVAHHIAKASQDFGACRTSSGIDTVSSSAPNCDDGNVDNTDDPRTPSAPAILITTTTNFNPPPAPPNFSCLHCARNFSSRIGLDGHLRFHRTQTGKPMPGVATYSRHACFHYPRCSHTFRYHMGLLGHRRLHDSL